MVDEKIFEVEGVSSQALLWEEHSFRMHIPQDALLPNETCLVTVKAIVGGLFQFPEGAVPVSAVYAISLSRQLHEPAKIDIQHCVKLENPKHSKFMSFAVASQDPSSMPYQFHEVPGGVFEENNFLGSVNRQQFSFMTIIWKLLGYYGNYNYTHVKHHTGFVILCFLDDIQYFASTFMQKMEMGCQLWILTVSKDLDTMKRVR